MPEGFTELERELQRDPRSKKFLDLARGYQKAGLLADALRVCESGLANNPNMAQARVLHAQLLLASGDLRSASASIQKALLVLPDNVAANHLAAEIFWGLGESGLALKHYQIVHLFDPAREGVAERIRALTAPAPPEVVPASEVDAILGTPREPEPEIEAAAPAAPPPPPVEAAEELPMESVGFLGPDVETPSQESPSGELEEAPAPEGKEAIAEIMDPDFPEETEVNSEDLFPVAPEEPPVVSEDLESAVPEGASGTMDVPSPEGTSSPADTPAIELPQSEDLLPSASDSVGYPEIAVGSTLLPVPEGDLLGGGFLDLGETDGWSDQEPEALAPVRTEPAKPPFLASREWATATGASRPAEAEAPSGPSGDSMSTLTLARLYEQQGYPEKAVEVYQRLLIRNPDDPQVLERIHGLRDQMERGAVEPEAVDQEEIRRALRQRSIRALNEWLRRMREERHVS